MSALCPATVWPVVHAANIRYGACDFRLVGAVRYVHFMGPAAAISSTTSSRRLPRYFPPSRLSSITFVRGSPRVKNTYIIPVLPLKHDGLLQGDALVCSILHGSHLEEALSMCMSQRPWNRASADSHSCGLAGCWSSAIVRCCGTVLELVRPCAEVNCFSLLSSHSPLALRS